MRNKEALDKIEEMLRMITNTRGYHTATGYKVDITFDVEEAYALIDQIRVIRKAIERDRGKDGME